MNGKKPLLFQKYIEDVLGHSDGYTLRQKFKEADVPWSDYLNYTRLSLDSSEAIKIGELFAQARGEDRIEALHWARYLIAMYKDDLIRLIEWHSGLERRIIINQIRRA